MADTPTLPQNTSTPAPEATTSPQKKSGLSAAMLAKYILAKGWDGTKFTYNNIVTPPSRITWDRVLSMIDCIKGNDINKIAMDLYWESVMFLPNLLLDFLSAGAKKLSEIADKTGKFQRSDIPNQSTPPVSAQTTPETLSLTQSPPEQQNQAQNTPEELRFTQLPPEQQDQAQKILSDLQKVQSAVQKQAPDLWKNLPKTPDGQFDHKNITEKQKEEIFSAFQQTVVQNPQLVENLNSVRQLMEIDDKKWNEVTRAFTSPDNKATQSTNKAVQPTNNAPISPDKAVQPTNKTTPSTLANVVLPNPKEIQEKATSLKGRVATNKEKEKKNRSKGNRLNAVRQNNNTPKQYNHLGKSQGRRG